jgi:hypothetical protein
MSCVESPDTQSAVDQLTSLIQLVSSQMDPSKSVNDAEKIDWLNSALKGKKSLIQYLIRKVIMDPDRSRNEHKLSLLLLALILRMTFGLSASEQSRTMVSSELTCVEGFWAHIRELIVLPDASVSHRCNALSVLVNAYRLCREEENEKPEWPSHTFSKTIISGVIDMIDKHNIGGSSSLTSRLMAVCLEYMVLGRQSHPDRFRASLKGAPIGVLGGLLETGGQILLAGKDRSQFFGFDPIIAEIDLKHLRTFVNELIEIGGENIYTPLALLCMESTPVVSVVGTPGKMVA